MLFFCSRSRSRGREGSFERTNKEFDKYSDPNRESHRTRDHDRDRRRPSSRERRLSRSKDLDRRDKEKRSSRPKDVRDVRRRSRSPRDKRRRSRSRGEKRRSRSKDRRRGTKSPDRRHSRSPRGERRRSRSRDRRYNEVKKSVNKISSDKNFNNRRRSPSPARPFRRGRTPPNGLGNRSPPEELTPEERDARTVFCMQLSQRIRARDLEEFFSSVGKVRDVRLITCNKTKRFKGIAYIEFKDPESVALVSFVTYKQIYINYY